LPMQPGYSACDDSAKRSGIAPVICSVPMNPSRASCFS
jgi:hypothetical protein